jgi:transposase
LVEKFDLHEFEEDCLNRGEQAGRPSWSPQVLISIWVYAYTQGMTSARAIERSMAWEPALRWLAADQSINHHTLSDFRMSQRERLDALFAKVLGVLQHAELVDLQTLLQDGTKVRAQASKDSFHRRKTLQEHSEEAQQVLAELAQRGEEEADDRRYRVARERAAEEKVAKMKAALDELTQREAETSAAKERAKLRVSETEPEARKMKHADGGWAPSYNVQVTTEAKSRIIAAVEVTAAPNDVQQLLPAIERVSRITGQTPAQMIADGGYVSRENIEGTSEQKVELIAPYKDSDSRSAGPCARQGIAEEFRPTAFVHDPASNTLTCPQGRPLESVKVYQHHGVNCEVYQAAAADCQACEVKLPCCRGSAAGRQVERVIESEAVQSFQRRMQTAEAQQVYSRRSEVAEFPHMWWKGTWKWRRFSVRGLAKAAKEALWLAIAYNIQQWIRLCWKPGVQTA